VTHPFRAPAPDAPDAPDVLICAGLDPSGGAGLIADVRVVSALGCRPVGVVTALTVQNTTAVVDTEAMNAERVREQLEFLLSDVEVRAVKIGMIGSSAIAQSVGRALALTAAPVVWDPIVHPSRGDVRFVDSLFGHAVAALAPHVTVLTPNAGELAFMTGTAIASLDDARIVGQALAARLRTAVLVKGGHLGGDDGRNESGSATSDESVDLLCEPGGVVELRGRRTPGGEHVHGTGCALSSALAAHLARGFALVDACRAAKQFVAERIASPVRPGRGAAAVV
jgi:hydroxymethylpyrimidine/phosphomethylpyrimidine kinase